LPLRLVGKSSWTSFVAANGQCMIFDTKEYKRNQWHKQVKNNPVEDIAIMKLMKKRKMKVDVLLGQHEISCRMYQSFQGALQGMARSSPAFFGNNIFWAFVFVTLVTFGLFFLLATTPWPSFILYLAIILFSKILVSLMSNQPVWINILLHPLHLLVLPVVVFFGWLKKAKGRYQWKGRSLRFN